MKEDWLSIDSWQHRGSVQAVWVLLASVFFVWVPPAQSADENLSQRTLEFETREVTDASLDLAPDGQTLVFSLLGDLYQLPLEGGAARLLVDGGMFDREPRLSPDGAKLAYLSDGASGGTLHPRDTHGIVIRAVDEGGAGGYNGEPVERSLGLVDPGRVQWTRDGAAFYVAARGAADADLPLSKRSIYLVPALEGAPICVTDAGIFADQPFVLRGGFGYVEARAGGSRATKVIALRAGKPELLFIEPEGEVTAPAVSPDAAWIAYVLRGAGPERLRLRSLTSESEKARDLDPATPRAHASADEVPGFAWTADGRALLVAGAGRLLRVPIDGTAPIAIPLHARVRFDRRDGPQPSFTVPSTRDPFTPRGITSVDLKYPIGKLVASATAGDLQLSAFLTPRGPTLSNHPGWDDHVYFSPTHNEVAFQRTTGDQRLTILRPIEENIARGDFRPLKLEDRVAPSSNAPYRLVGWHPDGERLLGVVDESTDRPIVLVDLGTGGLDTLYVSRSGVDPAPQFSRNDGYLYFTELDAKGIPNLHRLTSEASGWVAKPVTRFESGAFDGVISPNGESVAFRRNWQLFAAPFNVPDGPADADATKLTDACDGPFGWFPNSLSVYMSSIGSLVAVRIEDLEVVETPPEIHYGLSPRRPSAAITDVNIVDVERGTVIPHQTIVIEDGRILRITGAATPGELPSSHRVDGAGLFAIPGLFEMNARSEDATPRSLLALGVTTMRDIGSPLARSFSWKDASDAFRVPGPRVLASGPVLEGDFASGARLSLVARSVEELGLALDRLNERSLAMIEVGASLPRVFRQEAIARASERGQVAGMHASSLELAVTGLSDGARFLDGSPLTGFHGDVTACLAASGACWSPGLSTLGVGERDRRLGRGGTDDPILTKATWSELATRSARGRFATWSDDQLDAQVRALGASVAAAMKSGVQVAIGTGSPDAGAAFGVSVAGELTALVEGGVSASDALRAATTVPAHALGVESALGSLASGKLADIVLLRSNPLADPRALQTVAHVLFEGRPFAVLDLLEPALPVPAQPKPKDDSPPPESR